MIRPDEYITETCARCRRPGYRYKKHFALLTEEEQIKLFSHLGGVAEIKDAPKNAERCWVSLSSTINEAIEEGKEIAKKMKKKVAFEFNGKLVVVNKNSDTNKLYRKWWKKAYNETPEESFKRR